MVHTQKRSLLSWAHHRAVLLRRKLDPLKRRQYTLDRLVGPVGYWQELRAYQLCLLKGMGLEPHHSLLDVGCGPLQGGIAFIDYLQPAKYVGIDVDEEPLVWGYKQITEAGLVCKNPRLIRTSNFGIEELGRHTFDFVWISQILYHLSPELLNRLFGALKVYLGRGSVALGDVLSPCRPGLRCDSKWRGFDYHVHHMDCLRHLAQQRGLLVKELDTLEHYGYPHCLHRASNRLIQITRCSNAYIGH